MVTKKEVIFAHAKTHYKWYQDKKGCPKAKLEHDKIVKQMKTKGINHKSPFKCIKKR